MINAIINGIFSVLQGLISLVLAPIDLLLSNIPGINDAVSGINNFVQIIKNTIAWALDIIPPMTKTALSALFLAFAFFWGVGYTIKLIKITYNWIQKVKFW